MIQPSFNNIEPCLLQYHKLLFRQSVPFQVNTILSFMGTKITILSVTNNEIYPVGLSVNESMDVNNTKSALIFGSARILPVVVSNSINSARLSAVNRYGWLLMASVSFSGLPSSILPKDKHYRKHRVCTFG